MGALPHPGYLCGMASYVLVGEAATGLVLAGTLEHPSFPEALRVRGPGRWRWEAGFALQHATAHASAGDRAACIGKCAVAILAEAQARMLERRERALNEKGLVERADLSDVEALLAGDRGLADVVRDVCGALGLP